MTDTSSTDRYEVVVVGGGPAGMTAALYAVRLGHRTAVVDRGGGRAAMMQDVHNLIGVTEETSGNEFLGIGMDQLREYGCDIHRDRLTGCRREEDGPLRLTGTDAEYEADYVVLATGANRDVAEALGCEFDGDVVDVDLTMETSVDDAYATGAMVRPEEWQTVISAGDGAAAALNILTKERGGHYHDFDTPGDAEATFGGSAEE